MTHSELKSYNWQEALRAANLSMDDVGIIFYLREGQNDGDRWLMVFGAGNGRIGVLSAWCDYTGWDCQSGGDVRYASSVQEAVTMYLSAEERRLLGCTVPEDRDDPKCPHCGK